MSKNPVTSDLVLDGQSNWELWIFVVKRIAEAGDVWEYIDPDQLYRPLQKPEKPVRPAPVVNADGSPPTQPTQHALMQYNQDLSNYYKDIKEYRRLKDKLGQVEAHITKTIQQDLLYHIKDKLSIYDQIKTLQELYSPTTADQEYRVQKAYESAKTLHSRRSNIEDWCSEFLTAYNRAKQLNLPEVHGFRAHKDLVRAIKQVDAAYAASASLNIFKAEETWNLNRNAPVPIESQLSTVLADFLRYYRTTQSRKTNIHGGVFGATLNGQESPYKKKRLRSSARTRGFVEDPEKAKKITTFETSDTKGILNKIREKTRRYKKHKTNDAEKRTESDSIDIDAGDQPTDQSTHEAYAVFSAAFNNQQAFRQHPLLHSWTLDPATDIHICNNPAEFQWKTPAADDDVVLAGGSEFLIEAWGEVTIPLSTPIGIKKATLERVALIPSFFTSLVSLWRLKSSDIHFDSGRNVLYRIGPPREDVAKLTQLGGHWLIVHRSQPAATSTQLSVFATNQRRPQYSAQPLKPRLLTKPQLHVLLGHAGSNAIDQLSSHVRGILPPTGSAPATINCEECLQNKAHQIISRRIGHELGASRPFESVAIDLIQLDATGYNGHRYVFHGFDLYTKLNFVYTIAKRDKVTLLNVLTRLDRSIKREFNATVTFLIADDEKGYGITDDSARAYCHREGIRLQIRAPHTEEQNGSAERSGKNLIVRSRSMSITSNLPLPLAPEIYVAAAYLLNRTPTRTIDWKTPFEMAYLKQPSIAHLRVYGCCAYALRPQIPRGDKLSPRALIGYLVGYDSSNIYRVWLPNATSRAHQGKVIRIRDVTFKEDLFYQHRDESDPLLQGEELKAITHTLHMPALQDSENSSEDEYSIIPELDQAESSSPLDDHSKPHDQFNSDPLLPTPAITISPDPDPQLPTQASSATLGRSPTPEFQPSAQTSRKRKRRSSHDSNAAQNRELIDSNLRDTHILPEGSTRSRKPSRKSSSFFVNKYWSTFVAASTTAPKKRFHHSDLPPEPRFYQDVMKLPAPHRQGFTAAMQREITGIKRKGTYKTVKWKDFNAQDHEPAHTAALNDFERKLLRKYEIRSLGELSTFCGIQTHRDRSVGSILLSQPAYIDRLYTKYPSPKQFTRPPATPLPLEELLPSDEPKNEANLNRYAQLVGSIGYVATATRPDVSKAHSKLAEFLVNPTQRHMDAAYQTIAYLHYTKDQALYYDASISTDIAHIVDHEEPDFFGATDASYADHKATRKSSQGYIFFLFGGPTDWKATLQRCVTKSTCQTWHLVH
ncbi:hypothetical protein PTNB73_07013 [Pyrenophora teres f. teres]|uniref:Uncharacterized protein n=1 Tax=Pyrenophora teres f. teres TaxID=97479 RepID=A0A6S6WBR1_9PLEO|nr:hypothetical protein PTNB29_07913 [Pyrenophora teres f. teres]KAE8861459.1 hypothetical protein PTNB73_07013 [Pyrenophora teres f. teres]CAE7204972.1 hypothetical protein PTTW11_09195 [Pyrenophora teres f. teres]